ncbi:3-hydroxyacyl-CoA dehydrogenase family protein [Nitrospirillum viridazoti]|uniref:3-hydroxybutyryl-CoA dehydrogenase n=1 Tax=Nitrospirillum amazonense TaxID=28077 RepID=A0A560HJZ6_9PROT|nr:3-hydroxyacyl-CoA dehydrogenase family protein [Nitrospirillum amazonense]TWB46816.1 3-hydroxybutyryl-CoA dehydrogenase [Nitrospirillum amazonense]
MGFGHCAVAGAGTMGTGIAITIARSGIRTTLFDLDGSALERARAQISDFVAGSVKKGRLSQEAGDRTIALVQYTSSLADLSDVDVVVEAVFEDLTVKHGLWRKLNEVCKAEAIFLSNTSTLSITELAAGSGRPERVAGAHYCLPAQVMKLVECSRAIQTSDETWARTLEFVAATGQAAVETRDRPGFILNYFCIPYHNDVIRLIEADVAEPAEIDRAMKAAMGFAMGPCELLDMIGLDTQVRLSDAMHGVTNDPRAAAPPLLRRMVAAGLLGRKSGKGFYDYGNNSLYGA